MDRSDNRHRTISRIIVGLLLAAILPGLWLSHRSRPAPDQSIPVFQGVDYRRLSLPWTSNGGGEVHLFRIDLNAPGVELYLQPPRSTDEHPWVYRLDYPWAMAARQHLALAVDGVMFANQGIPRFAPYTQIWKQPFKYPFGDVARPGESVVLDHQASHYHAYSFMIWMDDQGRIHESPTLRRDRTPMTAAKIGIGTQVLYIWHGKPNQSLVDHPDEPTQRTVIGADDEHNILWLGAFQWANRSLVVTTLAKAGWHSAYGLDSGGSTALAVGEQASGIRPGTLCGGLRPVATTFGIFAQPLR